MKAILMSIRPKWVAKILNGEKIIEIRKRFPKDYQGWVYIYCTKGQGLVFDNKGKGLVNSKLFPYAENCPEHNRLINGKVVARFWCDKVEEISYNYRSDFTSVYTDTLDTEDLEEQACLTRQEFAKYLKGDYGYAIHITKLEIFDKTKEISEFKKCYRSKGYPQYQSWYLTKTPQSWCYIEIEEN